VSDADRKIDGEVPEPYPRTKFFANILKEKGRTYAWSHKAQTPNMVEKINKTTLIDEVRDKHCKPVAVEGDNNALPPMLCQDTSCSDDKATFEVCLQGEGMSNDEILACGDCIDIFLDWVTYSTSTGTFTYYCSYFQDCKDTCTKDFTTNCWDEAIGMVD
jgi:hypothetical protein